MTWTQRSVNAAENNFCPRLKFADIVNDFLYPRIPVGHHRLDKDKIKRPTRKDAKEVLAWPSEAPVSAGNVGQRCGLGQWLLIKSPAAELIAVSRDQVIKDGEVLLAKPARNAEQTIRAQPEVERREIVDWRVDQEDVHCMN